MKLEEWLMKNASDGTREPPPLTQAKNLHVIGTCGECEHWDPRAVSLEGWGNCDSYKVAAHTHETDAKRHADHGCIQFEPSGKIKGKTSLKKDIK